jgi:two-component system, NtrC family, nitrogen regulation response regulator NtrX
MGRVLVVDDEPGIRDVLRDVLQDEGYTVHVAEDGFRALALMEAEPIDVVLLDVWLPNMGGIEVLKRLREGWPEVEVIVISGHASIDLAVQATKMGALNFLEKPLSLDNTVSLVRSALEIEELRRENRRLRNSLLMEDDMVGSSPGVVAIKEVIRQSASTDSRVLITGENGTGKELVAREIHRRSRRAAGPFIEVNCAAIPDTLIESELFGHEKGAFTDAVAMRRGKFEMAHRGTLFLDEVADMSPSTQAKVLRAIQELRFERIGGEESVSVDVRLIAATNRDLRREIAAGRFREDLFFRLNVIPIHVPPLRERAADVAALVEYFMKKLRLPARPVPKRLGADALEALQAYPWPGNIRELKNFVERVTIMSTSEEISVGDVEQYLGMSRVGRLEVPLQEYLTLDLNDARERFEKDLILLRLRENLYNVTRTAQALGISASNLHNKIRKHGISFER